MVQTVFFSAMHYPSVVVPPPTEVSSEVVEGVKEGNYLLVDQTAIDFSIPAPTTYVPIAEASTTHAPASSVPASHETLNRHTSTSRVPMLHDNPYPFTLDIPTSCAPPSNSYASTSHVPALHGTVYPFTSDIPTSCAPPSNSYASTSHVSTSHVPALHETAYPFASDVPTPLASTSTSYNFAFASFGTIPYAPDSHGSTSMSMSHYSE